MQWSQLKNIAFLLAVFAFFSPLSRAQTRNFRLQTADSLFNARQFTQSLQHYESIFQAGEYSPAMLLRMAYVNEGLKRTGQTLYYLNLYYVRTGDESVLDKMEKLSAANKLYGYQSGDTQKATKLYREFAIEISLVLAALIVFVFALMVYTKRRKQQPVALAVVSFVLIATLGVHLFFSEEGQRAIVAGGTIYLMAGPSPAAPVVERVTGGHRVEILHRSDVWVAVEWKGQTAYIRENFLLPVSATL